MLLLLLACVAPDEALEERPERPARAGVPGLSVAPFTLDLGVVAVGESASGTLTLTSDGTATVRVDIAVESPTFGFSVGLPSLAIPPGDTIVLPVTFAPEAMGDATTRVLLTTDDPDADVIGIPVSGTGSEWSLLATPDTLDLGEVVRGCQAEDTLLLRAGGNRPTVVTALVFDRPEFHAVPPELPFTLEPGRSQEIVVGFDGVLEREWTGILSAQTENGSTQLATVTASVLPAETASTTFTVPPSDTDVLVTVAESVLGDTTLLIPNRLATLMEAVLLEDRRFAVVLGDDGCLPGGWIDPATADPHEALAEMLAVPTGDYTDSGLLLLERALTGEAVAPGGCNEGILRADARLDLVGLAAGPEEGGATWADYVAIFESLKADVDDVAIHVVAGDWPGGCGDWEPGLIWYEASVATGGEYLSICATDWDEPLADAVATEPWDGDVEVNDWPDEDTITVTVDGVPTEEWTYAGGDNALRFNDPLPPEGSEIVITYGLPPDCD